MKLPGVLPYKKPIGFNLISAVRPCVAFKRSVLRPFVGSYVNLGRIEGTRYKHFVIFLKASSN